MTGVDPGALVNSQAKSWSQVAMHSMPVLNASTQCQEFDAGSISFSQKESMPVIARRGLATRAWLADWDSVIGSLPQRAGQPSSEWSIYPPNEGIGGTLNAILGTR